MFLLKKAIEIACSRPATGRVYLTGTEALKNDNYDFYLLPDNGGFAHISSIEQGIIRGQYNYNIDKNLNFNAKIKNLRKHNFRIQVLHHYKGNRFSFDSPLTFIINHFCRTHILKTLFKSTRQRVFNLRVLDTKDRFDILEAAVSIDSTSPRTAISHLDVAKKLAKGPWIYHPQKMEYTHRIKLTLDSFCENGDLRSHQGVYFLRPKAIESLQNYQRDRQRHLDIHKATEKGNKLTLSLAVIGSLTILFNYYTWCVDNDYSLWPF